MMMLEHLEAAGLSSEASSRATSALAESDEPLPVLVSRLGLLPDDVVVAALAAAFQMPIVAPGDLPDDKIEPQLSQPFLKSHHVLPLFEDDEQLVVALVDPSDTEALAGLGFATRKRVQAKLIGFHAWRRAFDQIYLEDGPEAKSGRRGRGARWTDDAGELRDLALDAPAVRLAESLVAEAVEMRASDIHIERKPDGGLVRFRIDGRLRDRQRLSPGMADGVIARLKVLGDLDVADHRSAQDGRMALSARGRPVDLRLSIIPSAYGEGAAIRLLDRADIRLQFDELGFSPSEANRVNRAIANPQGLFLVSGPTGGGKTTTLYAAVNALRSPDRKIMTVEDPIEYFLDDVHQTQLDTAAGLGFANALRSFLRHDPDVILVGEIRDPDTAKTAVQAALTGHLVLSTIHANDAASVPTRLLEMGIEPYLLANTLTATSAQRLVRRLCPSCAVPTSAPRELLARAKLTELHDCEFKKAVGCETCSGGYSGRMVITETLIFDDAVADLVRGGTSLSHIREHITEPMLTDGLLKASRGLTSIDEVLRVLEAS
jgi:general secretion pathway protein E